jgi:hypothetical protein
LQSESGLSTKILDSVKVIYKTSGIKGFYAGIDSAILRQAIYATMRLGIYFNLTEALKNLNKD